MLVAAGLDWKVNKLPLSFDDGTGPVEVEGRYALVRDSDNRMFSITGESWKPLQNEDTLDFMRSYVEAGGAKLETAGSLRGGRVVWGLAKLDASFDVTRGDRVNGYLLITSPHEVGKGISIRTTTVRVVCANTMALAESQSSVHYRQSHMKDFDTDAAKQHVDLALAHMGAEERSAKALAKLKINLEDAVKKVIVPIVLPEIAIEERLMDVIMEPYAQPKALQQIIDSINNAPGAIEGNGWGVLNGFTHWSDHVAGRDQGARMWRSWMGDNGLKKQKVRDQLMELAS